MLRALTTVFAVLLASCGNEPTPATITPTVPAWAKVAPEQIAEAEKHGVPVAFENDLGMRFVLIPAGTFRMGSPKDEKGRGDDEPQRDVTLTRSYYLQATEVTNAQYRQWDVDHDCGTHRGEAFNGESQPVTCVSSWNALAFAAWLSARDESRTYRLPTDAEWEYACRAGTTTRFSTGRTIESEQANYDASGVWDGCPAGGARNTTTDAGAFAPNPWGLYDMHGNVWEWCADWWARTYSGEPMTDPQGPRPVDTELGNCVVYDPDEDAFVFSGEEECARVLRGGSWQSMPANLRSANRVRRAASDWGWSEGFRLVSPLPEPGEGGR